MKDSTRRTLLGALLAIMPLATACERVDDIAAVESFDAGNTMQSHVAGAKGRRVKVAGGSLTVGGTAYGFATRRQGVTLTVDGFVLEVPKSAVKERTLFVMTVQPGDEVKVVLKAWAGRDEVHNFDRPLKLTMPLSAVDPSALADINKFVLAEIDEEDGDIRDVVNAIVDVNAGTVSGYITHFSIWALAVSKEIIVGID